MRTIDIQKAREQVQYSVRKYWMFVIAFVLMAIYLKQSGPMNNWSGDAASIWETIKSFGTGSIIPSYVLYKGFASVYPYVWLYQLSAIFGLSEFVFVKIFHCLLFAYVSTIGFPYIAESLLNIKPKSWRKFILVLLMFWLWEFNKSFSQIMVDLPSLAYFLLLINSALKISQQTEKHHFLRYFYTGILLGLNMSLSGQYSLAALCVLLYIVMKKVPIKDIRIKRVQWASILCLVILIVGMIGAKGYNTYFEKTVVDKLRNEGGWIPDGGSWLRVGFYGRIDEYRWSAGPTIIDYRGLSILKDIYGDNYQNTIDLINQGKKSIFVNEYFSMVAKYPMDFLAKYANRLFLAVSPDGGYLSFSRLFIAYSLLFICFLSIKKRIKKVKDFFTPEILLYISFLLAIAAVIILAVEPRYVMQIQGLIFTYAILDDTLWNNFRSFARTIRQCCIDGSLHGLWERSFPYAFFIYLIFMLYCFAHIASLYETVGVDPGQVLFRF